MRGLSTLRLRVPMTKTGNDVYGELSVVGDTAIGSGTGFECRAETEE